MKTDSPVRAHSENNEGYKAFTKDKRTRTTRTSDAIFSSTRRESGERDGQSGEKRRSYNPNFTSDNRLTERNRRQSEFRSERSFGSGERNYNREERSFNREERGGFNREERGGFNRERNFNREERGGFNRERNFNREGGYQRRGERNFNREERPYNRERSFNREEREGGFQRREGGFQRREREAGSEGFQPRERNFHREEQPYNRERSFNREERGGFNRERNFNREERPYGERRNTRFNKPTAPKGNARTNAPKEPKKYINTANQYTIDNYPSYEAPKQDGAIRLNRYISMSGICSRREADEFIAAGQITVNGVVVTELGSKVMPNDEICYNGKRIENEKKVYIVMNKPKGFVTTLDDPHADKSVMDLVKNACTERIYPVGRLDKNSVGVLLLTNDGDLAKKLTHPTYEKKKIYQVSLDKHLTRADLEQLILGVTLEDGDIAADDVCYVDDPKMKNAVGIEIHSGRNRIVRRMFEHLGYHVGKLDRVYFAGLTKQKLKRGEWRFLTEKEVAMLKSGSYE